MKHNLDSETAGTIFTDKDAKLFRVKAVVAILDTPHYDYTDAVLSTHGPTSVKDSTRNKVGFANLYIENSKLVADIVLDYATPDRLDIDVNNSVYVNLDGFLVTEEPKKGHLNLYGFSKKVSKIVVLGLGLTHRRPVDVRIEPVGKPVLV